MENNNEKFKYSYSAPTQNETREIENIRKQYLPLSNRQKKYEELKNLDKKVRLTPLIIFSIIGIVCVLIFGSGMAMVLEFQKLIGGIVLSVLGAVLLLCDYFFYRFLAKKFKEKYSERILKLSDELLKEKDK